MKKPILVVMAAGMGSRYGGLKQIDPVGSHGEAILDYSLFDARRAGFETVVFIIKHEIEEDFKQTVGARLAASGMEIRYAYQQLDDLPGGYTAPAGRTKPWGTAHAVLSAREVIDAPFAVINADDYYGPAGFAAIYDYLAKQNGAAGEYAMVGFLLRNTLSENGYVSRGVCEVSGEGYLEQVTERTRIEHDPAAPGAARFTLDDRASWQPLSGDTLVSMNLWGFGPDFVGAIQSHFSAFLDKALAENPLKGEYYLPSVVSAMLAEQTARVRVLTSPDRWYGITYHEDKPTVQAAIAAKTAAGEYPAPLWG